MTEPHGSIVAIDDLAHTEHAHGPGELRLTAIHGGSRFDTEWLAGPDPVWTSNATR